MLSCVCAAVTVVFPVVVVRFTLRGRCTAHHSYITHFDFSKDGSYLQSNCGAYELLFFNPSTGEQIVAASATRDTEWASWTCTLGWPVQGELTPSALSLACSICSHIPSILLLFACVAGLPCSASFSWCCAQRPPPWFCCLPPRYCPFASSVVMGCASRHLARRGRWH